ncbi:MAG TPA: UrcA family protein [Gammaproteobacteria bacterium]|nr:UrcA family protein [Gammaproteobacteria bacterium]
MSKAALTMALFFGLAGVAGSACATTAASPDATETGPKSAIVRYHEQDLATSRGVQNLYAGIDRAARGVCDDTGEYVLRSSFAACERNAIANAVAQVDNAKLTQIYSEHFPRAPLTEAVSLRLRPSIIVVAG